MKKTIAILIALVMIFSVAIPAFAEGETYTLTIENTAEGHIYEAYQIFSGTLEVVAGTGTQVLTNITWGSSITDGAALLTEIDATAKAAEAGTPMSKLVGLQDAADLAEAISDNITSDSATLDALAAIFAKYVAAPSGTSTFADGKYTIADLTAGYYLVKDQDNSLEEAYDSYTKFILRVVKDETVQPKSSVPSVDKEINDTLDGTYTEYEDFDINDIAYYKWTGYLPSNLSEYEVYFYKFIDTMPTGIQFLQIDQLYLEDPDGNRVHTFLDLHDDDASNDVLPAGITLNTENLPTFTLTIDDIHSAYAYVLGDHKVIVKYSARITRDALYAEPMTNKVYVEYSNNPNDDQGGDHGKTPDDVAHAFTFSIAVDKYDADNANTKLAGAEFKLYFERIENDTVVKYYAQVVTEEAIEAGEGANGVPFEEKDLGVVYGWTTDESAASILDTDENGALNVRGLDADIYYLKETKAPAGYNLMESPVKIEIIPTYNTAGEEMSVTVSYKVDDRAQNSNVVGVRNSSGSTLPLTGGMGTTIFYIIGSLMFVGAAILLITRKRVNG